MFEYSADLFDATTVRRFAGQLGTLLAAAVAEPGMPPALLPLLSRRVEVHRLVLQSPDILLETDAEGRPNWAFAPAGVAAQPHTFYLGATGGGVWKTENAGQSWRNVSDGFIR